MFSPHQDPESWLTAQAPWSETEYRARVDALLADRQRQVFDAADLLYIEAFGPLYEDAIETTASALASRFWRLRLSAARALGGLENLGALAELVAPALLAALTDRCADVLAATAQALAPHRADLPANLAAALDETQVRLLDPAALQAAQVLERALWLPRALTLNGRVNYGAETDSLAIFSLRGRVGREVGQGLIMGPQDVARGMFADYGFGNAAPCAWRRRAADAEGLCDLIRDLSPLFFTDPAPRPAQKALAARLLGWFGDGVGVFSAAPQTGAQTLVNSALLCVSPQRVGLFWVMDED